MLVRSAPTPRRKKKERQVKKTKKKEIEGQKTKTPIPTRTIDALIGKEEHIVNRKRIKKEEKVVKQRKTERRVDVSRELNACPDVTRDATTCGSDREVMTRKVANQRKRSRKTSGMTQADALWVRMIKRLTA